MSERIMPIHMKESLDRRNDVLENFWERTGAVSDRKDKESTAKVIEIIKKSKEFIVIRTKKIFSAELIEALRDARERGVRIYGIIEKIKKKKKKEKPEKHEYLDSGIFRFSNDSIFSSYIISDPNGKKPKGLWVPIPVFNIPSNLSIELDGQYVRELWGHFSQEFWQSTREIFFGKMKQKVEVEAQPPELPATLKVTSRDFSIPALSDSEVETVVLPETAMEIGESFWEEKDWILDAGRLIVPLTELSRDFLDYAIGEDLDIFAANPGFGFIKLDSPNHKNTSFVFMPDMARKIPDNGKKGIEAKVEKSLEWVFNRTKPLKEIENEIILWDSKWTEKTAISVEKRTKLTLPDVVAENIDRWLEYEKIPRPELPDNLPLALDVNLEWKILPPYLPDNAKKHVLYSKWEEFQKNMHSALGELLNQFDSELAKRSKMVEEKKMKGADFRGFKGKVGDLRKSLASLESRIDGAYGRKVKAESIVEEFMSVKTEFEQLLDRHKPQDEEDSDEIGEMTEKNKKKQKKRGVESAIMKKEDIPRSLPKIGELYNSKNRDLLAIEFKEEIEDAKKEAKNYNARIVVKKEVT